MADLLTAPIWEGAACYPEMKRAWNNQMVAASDGGAAVREHIVGWRADGGIVELQEHLFECLALYAKSHAAWMPGFAVTLLPNKREDYGELRVYRDDFPVLRDLYIRTFETCHAALDVLVPCLNAAMRGDAGGFSVPAGVRKPAKTAS